MLVQSTGADGRKTIFLIPVEQEWVKVEPGVNNAPVVDRRDQEKCGLRFSSSPFQGRLLKKRVLHGERLEGLQGRLPATSDKARIPLPLRWPMKDLQLKNAEVRWELIERDVLVKV